MTVRPDNDNEIVPLPSTGDPLELLEIFQLPLAVTVPTLPDVPLSPIDSPLFVMLVHDPWAAEKLTPDVPPVRVMSIQYPDPTFAVFGKYQLDVLTPFSVALPLPARFSGVVPDQLGD